MRILLDVDGVLADFDSAAIDLVAGITGVRPTPGCGDYLKLPREQVNRFWQAMGQPGVCFALQPYPGAKEFVTALRDEGHELVFVTSPPSMARTWMWERTEWLKAHLGASRQHVVHCPTKYLVHGDVLVDDMLHNVHAFNETHAPKSRAVLFANAYNESSPDVLRLEGYEAVLKYVVAFDAARVPEGW